MKSFATKYHTIILLLLCNILFLLMFENSYLYNLYIGDTDSGIYQNIAKEILNGKILYKDVFDVKGPFIFFIYAIPLLLNIDKNVFILDSIIYSLGCLFLYKSLLIKTESKITSAVTLLIISFMLGVLHQPLVPEAVIFAINAYLSYWIISKKYLNASTVNLIICGILTGLVFWIKYNLGIFIATIYFYFIYKNRKLKNIFYPLLGFLMPTIIVLIYFGNNNSLFDLFNSYFFIPFKYSNKPLSIVDFSIIIFIMLLVGINLFLKIKDKNQEESILLIAYELLLFSSFILSGHHFIYYYIPIISCLIHVPTMRIKKYLPYMLCLFLIAVLPQEINTLKAKEETHLQYKNFASDMPNNIESIATIFSINTNLQLQLESLNYKYFFFPSLSYNNYPDLLDTLKEDIKNKKIEFVIIETKNGNVKMSEALEDDLDKVETLMNLIRENYKKYNIYGNLIVMKRNES